MHKYCFLNRKDGKELKVNVPGGLNILKVTCYYPAILTMCSQMLKQKLNLKGKKFILA